MDVGVYDGFKLAAVVAVSDGELVGVNVQVGVAEAISVSVTVACRLG